MLRNAFVGSAAVFALASTSGCVSNYNAIPGIKPAETVEFAKWRRSDYRIAGPASGSGCATYIGLWPIPIFWVSTEESSSGEVYAWSLYSPAARLATYRAIASVPSADMLLVPRYEGRVRSGGIWYSQDCVTVHGKAIEFLTDDALRARGPVVPNGPAA